MYCDSDAQNPTNYSRVIMYAYSNYAKRYYYIYANYKYELLFL